MRCTSVCPNDAFAITGLKLDQQLKNVPPDKVIVISCSRQAQLYPEECVVPCLAILSETHLLLLAMQRSALTLFNVSGCRDCVNKPGVDHVVKSIMRLREETSALFFSHLDILSGSEQISRIQSEHRRSFLSGMKQNLISAIRSQILDDSPQEELMKRQDRRVPSRVRLVRTLLEQANDEQKKLINALFVHDLEVSDTCTLCPLCKGICPTGAITIDKSNSGSKLIIDNTLCSGCGLCVTFCKHKAIRLHHPAYSPPVSTVIDTEGNPREMD
jgi:ferredoxin